MSLHGDVTAIRETSLILQLEGRISGKKKKSPAIGDGDRRSGALAPISRGRKGGEKNGMSNKVEREVLWLAHRRRVGEKPCLVVEGMLKAAKNKRHPHNKSPKNQKKASVFTTSEKRLKGGETCLLRDHRFARATATGGAKHSNIQKFEARLL